MRELASTRRRSSPELMIVDRLNVVAPLGQSGRLRRQAHLLGRGDRLRKLKASVLVVRLDRIAISGVVHRSR